jgi:hypothetical protein
MGQYAGGTSAQPFKTEKDYTNFLKEWIGFGGLHEKESKRSCTTKALTVKMIPQFADMPSYYRR